MLYYLHLGASFVAVIAGIVAFISFIAYAETEGTSKNIKKAAIGATIVTLIALGVSFGIKTQTESFQRQMRTINSDYAGGIERTVTVYSQTGEKIDEWHGKFDVESDGDSNEVMFDSEDGRVIIEGGIVVIEEN